MPFTYRLTSPVLFDPATGNVINTAGSVNDLHGITLTDDLNETGVDLTYISHTAYWESSGAPVFHTFDNSSGLLTFDQFPVVPAGEQIVIEMTVVLDNSPANSIGTQFVNTARWDFGRLIDGVFYEPLPGEWGISPPLTIGGPDLTVTKTGPATLGRTLNLGEWGVFGIDVQNAGLNDAWNVSMVDRLPNGPTGGMCDATPEILSAQVFQSDGTTPVAGKAPLVEGVDYVVNYNGAPQCELTIDVLSADGMIGAGERLIFSYRTQLDSDSQDGATLTNVVGATRWYNGDSSNADRIRYDRNVTNGTVGILDHQDAHTVTVALFGYFFEKTVENRATGDYPATTADPGDTLRYSLRLQTTDGPLSDVSFVDDLGAMNAGPVFVPGSLTFVPGSVPPGLDTSNTNPNGGSNGDGLLDVRGISLPADSEITIQFDITLDGSLIDGTLVTNQAELMGASQLAVSDDPFVNGQADPSVPGDEDPTQLIIEGVPPLALAKAASQATATIGETFSYTVTVPSAPHTSPLYDVRILDDLAASAADLEFVSVQKISTGGAWTPVNTGTATDLVIEDAGAGIDLAPGEQAVVEITVRLLDTPTNVAGLSFANTAAYTYNLVDDDPGTVRPGEPGVSGPMTVVEPDLTLEKSGPLNMRAGVPGDFTLNVHNVGDSPAWNVTITDLLPNQSDGGMCDAAPAQVGVQLYEADGVTPIGSPLVAGTDYTATFNGDPTCTYIVTLTSTPIDPDQRLLITYQASLDANTQLDVALTNIAGATEWFSLDQSDVANASYARTYTRTLSDGTVGTLDHEDAHTVVEFTPLLIFEKTAFNVTSGENPADDGDTRRHAALQPARRECRRHGSRELLDHRRAGSAQRRAGIPARFAECHHGTRRRRRIELGCEWRCCRHRTARRPRPEYRRSRRQPADRIRGATRAGHCQRHVRLQPVGTDLCRPAGCDQ